MNHFLDHLSTVDAFATDPSIAQAEHDFVLRENPLPVMFSAPNAAEPFAAALGLMMAEGGFPAIVRTRADEQAQDADYDLALAEYAQMEKIAVIFELGQLPADSEMNTVISLSSAALESGLPALAAHMTEQLDEVGIDGTVVEENRDLQGVTPSLSVAFNEELFNASGVAGSDAENIASVLKRAALFAVAQVANGTQNG